MKNIQDHSSLVKNVQSRKTSASDPKVLPVWLHIERKGGRSKKKGESIIQVLQTKASTGQIM